MINSQKSRDPHQLATNDWPAQLTMYGWALIINDKHRQSRVSTNKETYTNKRLNILVIIIIITMAIIDITIYICTTVVAI